MTPEKTSSLAIWALVLAILCPPIGLILGIIAYVKINDSRGALGGKGIAIAAMVMPICMVPVSGCLAAIAIPNFIRYQLRAKASEAKVVLSGIKISQEAFHADYGAYVGAAPNPPAPPGNMKAAWDARACPSDCTRESVAGCTELSCIGYQPPGPVYYRYACAQIPAQDGSSAEFTCVAVADLDGDGERSVFLYGSAHGGGTTIRAPIPELAGGACREDARANEIVDCTRNVF